MNPFTPAAAAARHALRLASSLLAPLALLAVFVPGVPPAAAQTAPPAAAASAACPPVAAPPTPDQLRGAQAGARDRGFLWRIEKDGRTSWLYGTVHLGKLDWAFPGPQVMAAFRATDALALEIDLADPAVMEAARAAMAPPVLPAVPAALQQRLVRQEQAACLPPQALAAMHPLMRAITLIVLAVRWDGLDAGYAQEIIWGSAARAAGKPISSLETAQAQMALLLPSDTPRMTRMLEQSLEQLEAGTSRRVTSRLAQAWAEGRLDELTSYEQWCECVLSDEDRSFMRRLNDERNPALAQGIDALHTSGKTVFAAVGALHMTGPQALPALMAQRGYKVERVSFLR